MLSLCTLGAIAEAKGPAPTTLKNGGLPSSVSSRACLSSEIAVARSISRVVQLPSGEAGSSEIIAHGLVAQFMRR